MLGLAYAITGHLVGDYLLQNDWQAAGKKKSSLICGVHCLLWTGAVLAFTCWWHVWWVPIVLFVTHFIQDRTNIVRWKMEHTGQKGFAQPPMAPWSMIVVDNTLHIVVLAIIAAILGVG